MKILLINNYGYRRGGAESFFLNTGDLLKSKGHIVKLFSLHNPENEYHIDFSFKESKFLLSRFYSLEAKKKIKEVLNYFNPDVIHINNIIGRITFSILPEIKKKNIPVVASIHDFRMLCPVSVFLNGKNNICEKCKVGRYYHCIINKCNPEGLFKNILIAAESYFRDLFLHHEKFIDKYIFVSHFTKNKFLEFYPNLASKSEVLYNFSTTFYKEIKRGKYFLYFGRLDREKGINTLIKAFEELKQFDLIILGKGKLESEITNLNQTNIKYLGYQTGKELENIIINSHFVIIPSECFDNLVMAGVESLSMSKPIIVSNIGGLVELVDSENNGFIFEAGNKESLKHAIQKSNNLSNDEYYKISNNAYRFAEKHFNSEHFYNKLEKIYQSLIH